jgi:hypothetical protein
MVVVMEGEIMAVEMGVNMEKEIMAIMTGINY